MMHLKAKCDLWIANIHSEKGNWLCVQAGKREDKPIGWLNPYEYGQFYHLQSGDTLTFKAIADGSDPYAQLATRYPEWFEVVESVP